MVNMLELNNTYFIGEPNSIVIDGCGKFVNPAVNQEKTNVDVLYVIYIHKKLIEIVGRLFINCLKKLF